MCRPLVDLLALLAVTMASCRASVPFAPAAGSEPRSPAASPNASVDEATTETAGAEYCTPAAPTSLGRARSGCAYAVAFGTASGLVVWQGPNELDASALGADGLPRGAVHPLPFPRTVEPTHVVPVDGGFVVVGADAVIERMVCAALCVDRTCGRDYDGPVPHVCHYECDRPCSRTTGQRTLLLMTNTDGAPLGQPRTVELGLAGVAAVTPAFHDRFAIVGSNGTVAEGTCRADGAMLLETRKESLLQGLLPVRGEGPATLVMLDVPGHFALLDAAGVHPIRVGKEAPGLQDRLLARHGADGRIHLAWAAPHLSSHSAQCAVVKDGILELSGAPRSTIQRIEPPFERYVFAYSYPDGSVERRAWPDGAIGRATDLRAADPELARAPLVEWTGSRFLALYTAGAPESMFRALPFDCAR